MFKVCSGEGGGWWNPIQVPSPFPRLCSKVLPSLPQSMVPCFFWGEVPKSLVPCPFWGEVPQSLVPCLFWGVPQSQVPCSFWRDSSASGPMSLLRRCPASGPMSFLGVFPPPSPTRRTGIPPQQGLGFGYPLPRDRLRCGRYASYSFLQDFLVYTHCRLVPISVVISMIQRKNCAQDGRSLALSILLQEIIMDLIT